MMNVTRITGVNGYYNPKTSFKSKSMNLKECMDIARQKKDLGFLEEAEHYYNIALNKIKNEHNERYQIEAFYEGVYDELYDILIRMHKIEPAKAIANTLINNYAREIFGLFTFYDSGTVSGVPNFRARAIISNLYKELAYFCKTQGEEYPSKVCEWAASEIMPKYGEMSTLYGNKILKRRCEKNIFIGDLYDECH